MRNLRNQTVSHFLTAPRRFAIYGTGEVAEATFRALAEHGLKPNAFLDADRTGEILGLAILPPEEALGLDLVVTAGGDARDMTVQLRADGFEGPVLDLTAAHDDRAAAWFDDVRLAGAAGAIGRARNLFEDDGSREVFDGLLRYRQQLDPGDLPPAPPDLGHPAVPGTDGDWALVTGAEEDECLALAEAVGPEGCVHILEPDPMRLEALRDVAATSHLGARLSIHALACGARCHEPGDDGSDPVPGVTVDEFVWDTTSGRLDRLEVSGCDAMAILDGASATLSEHRPRLSVDLSISPSDLWEIPTYLKDDFPGYRLHLAHHSQGLALTRLYASVSRS
ncbi:MAG: hypothetical protein JRH10_15265 [Deltaproteobacteria bacterium]|nr:hypothetical protein [Deltaproteobacteria bacterium]MBW2445158.1 hypothetical protein [Deltaproteobacteria bacterium]